jgi:DNA topoisomerase VI subunit A
MKPIFDAKEASRIAKGNSEEHKSELDLVLEDIKRIAELGRDNIFMYDKSQATIKELRKLGFKVEAGQDYGETTAHRVSW